MRFQLINSDGCLFDSCEAVSFNIARSIFNQSYTGKFIIIDGSGERKNVILK